VEIVPKTANATRLGVQPQLRGESIGVNLGEIKRFEHKDKDVMKCHLIVKSSTCCNKQVWKKLFHAFSVCGENKKDIETFFLY